MVKYLYKQSQSLMELKLNNNKSNNTKNSIKATYRNIIA